MFLVDTDVLSALSKRRRDPNVEAWFARRRDGELFLSVVSVGEIERGIALRRAAEPEFAARLAAWLDRILAVHGDRILPFDLPSARRWGALCAALRRDGADLQIAATAIEHGLTVATRNVAHFAPTGVAVVDPFDPGAV
jgi:predicted nucleic acid-binding protein